MKIIGRKDESAIMESYLDDKKSHLLALIGRRRVGKTFLIRRVYAEHKVFELTGIKNADLNSQIMNFKMQLSFYFPAEDRSTFPINWLELFHSLTTHLNAIKTKEKPVVFFDELPWIASNNSGFTEALAHWWNNWASEQNIIVVICGSAASWMIEHVVNAKGGLHNRITKLISLQPFSLEETKEFLEAKHIKFSYFQLAQLYMSVGGIPHYLNQIEKGKSAAQTIQELCFSKDGVLRNEFDNLYPALFDNAQKHIQIIKALANKSIGLDRQQILTATSMTDGGYFSTILGELEISGFITANEPLEKKKKDILYRLTDEYSLFYLKFIDGRKRFKSDEWMRISQTQKYKIWCGYAFESLCLKHIHKIKQALGISGVQTSVNSFLHRANKTYEKGFQIDILIDRRDDIINICEMKFYADEFSISAPYAKTLRTKKQGLMAVTKTKKMVHLTFITAYGVLENSHKLDLVDSDFTLEVLF